MWARPAQFARTGPDSAQKGWADLGLIVISVFLVWARTSLAQKRNKTGGNYFPPPILLHAERISFCMHEKLIPKMK